MKSKFSKFLLMFISFFAINVVVFAEVNDNNMDEASNDATLKDVYINSEKILCNENVCEYIIENNDINEVKITYKTNDENASVSKNEIEEKVVEGENKFTVLVTAEDGTTQEYIFKVIKKVLSTDSSLKKITINDVEVDLKKDVTKYSVSVSYATKKIDLVVEPNSEKATVKDLNNNKASYDFFDTEKNIEIKVVSEAGDMTTYVLTISKREEQDATLKNLTIDNVDLDFESGVFDYEANVLKNVTALEIEAIANDSNANIEIKGADNLQIGENTVTITVENDENIKTYTLKITRLDEDDQTLANLKSLTIKNYKLDFKEDVYEYDLKIGNDNYLIIDAVPKVEDIEPEITGNLDLVDGSIIKIKVVYDENIYNVYRINIIKEEISLVEKNNNKIIIIIIIVISLILLTIIILLIIKFKNKKKNKKNDIKNNKIDTKEEIKKGSVISISDDEKIDDII